MIRTLQRNLQVAMLALGAICAPVQGISDPVAKPVLELLRDAQLFGSGTMRWFGLKIYDAQLWVKAEGFDPDRFANSPFILELHYARSLSGVAIAKASDEQIARLRPTASDRRQRWLQAMSNLFPDVVEGDRIAGLNRPGVGARFFLNGKPIGDIDDPAFAGAFFAIWLDPNTSEPGLRARLLSGAKAAEPRRP
ncbi:MAG: chalcone isomerase family protein [Quisquiliibacterium sp.]